jgi:hypothetical protein
LSWDLTPSSVGSRPAGGPRRYALSEIGDLIQSGGFSLLLERRYRSPNREAHRVGEAGRVRGYLALLVD